MKLEVQWLAYLATQDGLLDSAKCLVLKQGLGPDADILTFGEKLYDRGYCPDFENLQALVKTAYKKAENNEPVPSNPFQILPTVSQISIKHRETESEFKKPVEKPTTEVKPLSLRTQKTDAPLNVKSESSASDSVSNTLSESNTRPASKRRPSSEATKPSIPPIQPWKPSANRRLKPTTRPEITSSASPVDPPQTEPISLEKAFVAEPKPTIPISVAQGQGDIPKSTIPELTKCRPNVSLDVPDQWPDFEAVSSMSDESLRQCVVQILLRARNEEVSDIHLSAGSRPFVRRYRKVEFLSDHTITKKESKSLNTALLSEFQIQVIENDHDLDCALSLDLHQRYRVNLMNHKDGYAATYRVIPHEIRSLEELGFGETETIRNLLSYHNGLIMVTGPLGSGKTATLAALVDELNKTRQDHLISVESPIEIVQQSELCQITQREVGNHTQTFQSALKGALRQDPDIIVIGEMRDLETVEMAISASETGHLVIGTMHTSDAANTLNRLLDVFPAAQQTQIRSMVAESLRGIVCQRLLPSTDGGLALAYELLLNNPAVGNLIRNNKADGLSNVIETGRSDGMVLMDRSIYSLWENGRISDEVAFAYLESEQLKDKILRRSQPATDTDDPVKSRFSLRT